MSTEAVQIPYHELPATPGEMQLVNGIEGKTSEGSSVKIWQIDSPAGGFDIEMTKPLEKGKESKLEFALTTEAAAVLLAGLGTSFDVLESGMTNTETEATKFEPCPFCGATESDQEMDPDTGTDIPCLALHNWKGIATVQCCRCGSAGPLADPEKAVAAWNLRDPKAKKP